MFKYACIAAVAFAGMSFSAAPAQADASNCQPWNGPYCEFAHNVRHHGYRLPIVWEQPYVRPYYPVVHTHQVTHAHPAPYYPATTYPVPPVYWSGAGTCRIESAFGCRFRSPLYAY